MGISAIIPKIKTENTFTFDTSLWTSNDKIILAPMQGLTEYYFRNAFAKTFPNCINKAVSPFISVTHGKLTEKSNKKYHDVVVEKNNNGIELIPQIIGNDTFLMIDMINALYDMGYKEVNWNLGCPFKSKRDSSKDRGAALLQDTSFIESIIAEVIEKSPIKLSLKVRLGYESTEDIYKLIPIINSYPIHSVTIHPRLGVQEYSGKVDLDTFEDVYKQINKKVIYNGDICTVADFTKLKLRFPDINQWMIGRGLLYNPFLASEIRGINYANKKERLLFLHNEIVKESISVNKIKEYWRYFSKCLNWDDNTLKEFLSKESFSEVNEFINTTLNQET